MDSQAHVHNQLITRLIYTDHKDHNTTRNVSSHITCSPTLAAVAQQPQQPHDHDGLCNSVILIFRPLGQSMHAERLPYSIRVPNLVLVAQAIFLLDDRHIHTNTDRHTHSHRCHWSLYPTLLQLLHAFNGIFSMATWVIRHQKDRNILDFNEPRDDGAFSVFSLLVGWQERDPACKN